MYPWSNYLYVFGSCGGVRTEPSKLQANACSTNEDPHERIIGFDGVLSGFIPNYPTLAAPLTDLTRKTAPMQVQLTEECDRAFNKLKQQFCSSPVLSSPDYTILFVLQTNASERGAVLSQCTDQGEDHPIAYFSNARSSFNKRYSTIKVCLVLKMAMNIFRTNLIGHPLLWRQIIAPSCGWTN